MQEKTVTQMNSITISVKLMKSKSHYNVGLVWFVKTTPIIKNNAEITRNHMKSWENKAASLNAFVGALT